MIQIKHRWTGAVIFESKSIPDLSGADLSGADLYVANLSGANLFGANLLGANLSGANLSGANLSGANLFEADLSGANLFEADLSGANLSGANLFEADLSGANLSGANLSGADLSGANLYGANLFEADLSGANLFEANLSGANLSGANGMNKYLTTPLLLLYDQVGKIRAYKLVSQDNTGPYYPSIKYITGKTYAVDDPDTNENHQCGSGINLATLDWCIKEWKKGYKILIAEFTAKDIACIPIGSDGKFRVSKCKIVGEKDLKEIGVATGVLE